MMAEHDSVFTEAELAYLHGQRRLGRIATVGADGTPHVSWGRGPPRSAHSIHRTGTPRLEQVTS